MTNTSPEPGSPAFVRYLHQWLDSRCENPALLALDVPARLDPADLISVVAVRLSDIRGVIDVGPCQVTAPHCHLSAHYTIAGPSVLLRETLGEERLLPFKQVISTASALYGLSHDDAFAALVQTYIVASEFSNGVSPDDSRLSPKALTETGQPLLLDDFLDFCTRAGPLWLEPFIHNTAHIAPDAPNGVISFAFAPPIYYEVDPEELDEDDVQVPFWTSRRMRPMARQFLQFHQACADAGMPPMITFGSTAASTAPTTSGARTATAAPVQLTASDEAAFQTAGLQSRAHMHLSARGLGDPGSVNSAVRM